MLRKLFNNTKKIIQEETAKDIEKNLPFILGAITFAIVIFTSVGAKSRVDIPNNTVNIYICK